MGSNRYCAKCGYELPRKSIKKCPECGNEFGKNTSHRNRDRKQKIHKASKKWNVSVVGFQLMCAAIGGVISLTYAFLSGISSADKIALTIIIGAVLGWLFALLVFLFIWIRGYIKRRKTNRSNRPQELKNTTWHQIWPYLVVMVVIFALYWIISWISVSNAVNYVVKVCEESGVDSSACARAQSDKGVSCSRKNIFGIECSKRYTIYTPYFY